MNANVELATVIHALKVAEHRSFRRATEALGICQSSIKPVRKLENMLGVDLFDRYHAGVKVTNAGRQFFEHIKMALDHLDSAVSSAGMAGRVENGSLKTGIFSSLASGFLPELLRCYLARHPGIDIGIVEAPPSENLARLRAEELDIVFIIGEPLLRPIPRPPRLGAGGAAHEHRLLPIKVGIKCFQIGDFWKVIDFNVGTVRMKRSVILMIGFSRIKCLQWLHFGHDPAGETCAWSSSAM